MLIGKGRNFDSWRVIQEFVFQVTGLNNLRYCFSSVFEIVDEIAFSEQNEFNKNRFGVCIANAL